ncbi:MAG: lytic transglycosylase domain-containing protein [Haliscomenobacter sp.]|nr:lytic transglycosylase domain-containing protein [Haliscomenobacter sp.]
MSLEKDFYYAGEKVPTQNFDVRERLERELLVSTYQHATTLLSLKKAARYFPLFDKVFKENGIPEDFRYMAVAESNLNNVVSSAGARGIWQFMESAAEYYGLEVSEEVDERYHPEKATQAAARFIKDHYKRFGNWTLAAAAYNVGGTRISKELQLQGVKSYYDLQINDETSRYLFRLLAYKEIFEHPETYGYYLEKNEAYPPLSKYKSVEVKGAIPSLAQFAQDNGTTLRMLKLYNPWLISVKLANPAKKTYEVKIPE